VEDARDELNRLSEELAALGIGPVKDEQIDSLVKGYEALPEEHRSGIDLTHELLYEIGMGDYDYDSGDWKPSSHRVYAFDTEVFDINRMYTNFLKGVSARPTPARRPSGSSTMDTTTSTPRRFKATGWTWAQSPS
jgi:hypothetical protein